MTFNAFDKYCEDRANIVRARLDPLYFSGAPEHCDVCGKSLSEENYFGDCEVPGKGGRWAYFCQQCMVLHRVEFGWGRGQLYQRVKNVDGEWLLVAGFAPPTP